MEGPLTDILDVFAKYDFLVRHSLILVIVALSAYLLLNAGIFAVPQIGLMAVGAYTAAVLSTRHDTNFYITAAAGTLAAGVLGLILGATLMRLDGIYLAIATIGFNEIVRVTIRNLEWTGGPQGLVGVERATNDLHILGTLLVALVVLRRLTRTRFGLAIEAMREDPLVAAHQGVYVHRYRLLLFGVTGLLCGLGGALYAHLTGFVEPSAFDFDVLISLLAATILGGMTFPIGPLVGGVVMFGVPEFLTVFGEYRRLFNGAVIVLVIAFAPDGVVGLTSRIRRRFSTDRSMATSVASTVSEPTAEGSTSALVGAPETAGAVAKGDNEVPVLDVQSLSMTFGGLHALSGVTLDLFEAEMLGLIGPNGSGKTTLLNILSGVYSPESGEIRLAGMPLIRERGRPERIAACGISRTFQGIRLIKGRTVKENVRLGAYLRQKASFASTLVDLPAARRERHEIDREVDRLLEELEISDLANREVGTLPYGPQRKVEIARALIANPRVLLVDEPTAGMAPTERQDIFRLLTQVRVRGITVVVVEHDVDAIVGNCDRAAVLNFGQVIAVGRPADVMREEAVIDAYIGRRTRR
jgi:branched-chain amino acid transport system permease protein